MKFKKAFLLYLTIGFFLSFPLISPSLAQPNDIEWSVKEGDSYTWIVKTSKPGFGFPPVGSKFKINITSIQYYTPSTHGNASRIYAIITYYNATNKSTYTILDNSTFIFFNHTNTIHQIVSFYSISVRYHGFFTPFNYGWGWDYLDGLSDWFYAHGFSGYGATLHHSTGELISFNPQEDSTNLMYGYKFKNNISYKLEVIDIEDNTKYLALLEGYNDEHAISYGNFFLIFSGVAILSLIYIYMKKNK